MTCPQCHQDQGDKELRDFKWWFQCYACQFTCYLKNYRSLFFQASDEVKLKRDAQNCDLRL